MKKCLKKAVASLTLAMSVFLVGVLSAVPTKTMASGGVQRQLENTFGLMMNVNEPAIVNGARQGIITGGSFQIRNKIQSSTLFSMQPPSISFGCGGWDVFTGSFSFISSEQIVSMLRSIASATAVYFFRLALNTISADIGNIMGELWDKISQFNNLQLNSCKIGATIAQAGMDRIRGVESESLSSQLMSTIGIKDDNAAAQNQGASKSPGVELAERDVPEVKQIMGNYMFLVMDEQSAGSWIGSSNKELIEHIMSITGTMIVCAPGVDGCPKSTDSRDDQEKVRTTYKPPILSLRDLVKGAAGENEITFRYYKCNNSQTCLDPQERVDNSFVGMEKMLMDRLLGTTRSLGDGLIGRHANNLEEEPGDRSLISAGGSFVGMAMNLAIRNEHSARNFLETYSEVISAEITMRIISDLLKITEASASRFKRGELIEVQEMLLDARQRMVEDVMVFHANAVTNSQIYAYYNDLLNSQGQAQMPVVGTPK